ncbi:hypothetical protein [Streptomyces sp. NPDC049970]|uniref:hypothetical protein n=1 Tax=Streptomyces sp. NPDC049970 TaxID=3155033 RepID=UPI0034473D81
MFVFVHVYHSEHRIRERWPVHETSAKECIIMSLRAVVVLLCCSAILFAAALTAGAAGWLARRDGASYPAAITRAATAFAATLTLAAVSAPRFID